MSLWRTNLERVWFNAAELYREAGKHANTRRGSGDLYLGHFQPLLLRLV